MRARIGPVDSSSLAVYTHDHTAGSHQISSEKRNIPTATTNIEDTHTFPNPSLLEQLARKRSKSLALTTETLEFLLGMT
jgi:hypothetical protein